MSGQTRPCPRGQADQKWAECGGRDCGSTVSDQGGALRRHRSGRDQEATGRTCVGDGAPDSRAAVQRPWGNLMFGQQGGPHGHS